MRFELMKTFALPAFQASALDRYANPPLPWPPRTTICSYAATDGPNLIMLAFCTFKQI